VNRTAEYKTLKIFEWSFFIGAGIWTLLTAAAFIMAYHDTLDTKMFSLSSTFYWLTVSLYAASRKITRHHFPEVTHFRKSEFILIAWMILGLIYGAKTIFMTPEKLPLMQEFLMLYGILIGILLGGKALDRAITAFMSPK
jgi:hypothetical protein